MFHSEKKNFEFVIRKISNDRSTEKADRQQRSKPSRCSFDENKSLVVSRHLNYLIIWGLFQYFPGLFRMFVVKKIYI